MTNRMTDALTRDGRTPLVDLLAPPPDPAPAPDVVDALLTTPDFGDLTDEQRDKLVRLDAYKRAKSNHEKAAKVLGKDVDALQTELIELGVELGLIGKDGRLAFPDVSDGQGFTLHPYEVRQTWPKYREDPDTDQPYTRDQLIEVLREIGLEHLVVESTAQFEWPGYVRERVKAWRQMTAQSGVRDDQGRFVDFDGEPLDAAEAADPMADILALPRKLRAIIEPTDKIMLQFSRRAETGVPDPTEPSGATTDPAGDPAAG